MTKLKESESLVALKEQINKTNNLLDLKSNEIRQLENSLRDLKAHYPFQLFLSKEISKPTKLLSDSLKDSWPEAEEYFIVSSWFLEWNIDENSKNYRLFIKKEENEMLSEGFEEFYKEWEISSIQTLKKPFIETNRHTRLEYSKYLAPFMDAFNAYLKEHRISIENSLFNFYTSQI